MHADTMAQIEQRLHQLRPEKLTIVLDFVTYLAEREAAAETLPVTLASEQVLRRDWDTTEEDAAWSNL